MIGLLVTARMGSTRLPNKHFREIGGQPALSHLLARIESEFKEELTNNSVLLKIVTGNQNRNKNFASLTVGTQASVFYGHDTNVPLRHLQTARACQLDAIVSIDGDDIFTAPEALRAVYELLVTGASVAKTTGLPLGMNAWGYSVLALQNALYDLDVNMLETGWGRIFDKISSENQEFRCDCADRVRATLDYDEDLRFFDSCVNSIHHWQKLPVYEFVDQIVKMELHEINASVNSKYWDNFNMNIATEQVQNIERSYSQRLNHVIPGGSHTYSRGDDQYPSNAPQILTRGKGAYVWGPDGQKFLDYGMALRAVSIGYAEPEINAAAFRGMELGNSLTRASMIELEAAELLVSLIDSVDMVKFTKNGSTATSAAVKLARAYTGRNLVARCAQHPFFSFDDWFIGSTPITKGIPQATIEQTKQFIYNDIESLENLVAIHPGEIACVILEPAATECPAIGNTRNGCCGQAICSRKYQSGEKNYLQQVEELCRRHGIVFILDETITGFRWHLKGAQYVYGVTPDLCTFGKSMANGFSVAAVAGRRELMELGAIDKIGQERLFLLSTTHGAEMSGLNAFIATVKFLDQNEVLSHLWKYGASLISTFNRISNECGLLDQIKAAGPAANPYYATIDVMGNPSFELRTLFSQEMIRRGVLMPWLAFSYRHGSEQLRDTETALRGSMDVCKKALAEGMEGYLNGPTIKPVFRRFN